MQYLILGGARSGKSRYAEQLASSTGKTVVYIATATAQDAEMQARIAHHQASRPADWRTVEEPLHLAACLAQYASADTVLVVDCLTLWLTHLLCHADTTLLERETQQLLATLPQLAGDIVCVSNEVGLGIVPLGELTRRYVDEAGRLHQQLAVQCTQVVFMVAGLPHVLKNNA